jgi:hypothetical protein
VPSPRATKIAFRLLLVVAFIGLFPVSIRVADPLFSRPFRAGWQYTYPVLLVWPDHVWVRWFRDLTEISPRPRDANYTFNVAPERQRWIEQQIRNTPLPKGVDAGWIIKVKQISPSKQRIELEVLGDGITGLIYEAGPDAIVPLKSRLAGPLDSLIILAVHLLIWGSFWLLAWIVFRFSRRRGMIALGACLRQMQMSVK